MVPKLEPQFPQTEEERDFACKHNPLSKSQRHRKKKHEYNQHKSANTFPSPEFFHDEHLSLSLTSVSKSWLWTHKFFVHLPNFDGQCGARPLVASHAHLSGTSDTLARDGQGNTHLPPIVSSSQHYLEGLLVFSHYV